MTLTNLLMALLLYGFVFGMAVVASNPSPYFAAFGLVVVSALGCGILAGHGGPFLSLVLFLIYLGGMLVVFAYCAALAAEPYPMSLGDLRVLLVIVLYFTCVILGSGSILVVMFDPSCAMAESIADNTSTFHGDAGGLGHLYSTGGWLLVVSAWVLLLTLFVVLELTRGLARGGLRAV